MPTGSCMCGAIKLSYEGDPVFTYAIAMTTENSPQFSVYQIRKSNFTLTSGTPKTWTKLSDSNREITNHFCDTCGTTLYRTGGNPNVEGMIGLRAGILDDQSIVNRTSPAIEVFVERKPDWMKDFQIGGAVQMNAEYEVVGNKGRVEEMSRETGTREGL